MVSRLTLAPNRVAAHRMRTTDIREHQNDTANMDNYNYEWNFQDHPPLLHDKDKNIESIQGHLQGTTYTKM